MMHFSLKMNLFLLRVLILSSSVAGLYQIGGAFNSSNLTAWAQAVPLIPVQTGNGTLDQGIPVFYDCIEEIVDESYSEQEPSYFHDEPTKAEVNDCYNDVFVVNGDKLKSANQVDTSDNSDNSDNSEEKLAIIEEVEEDQDEQSTENTETERKDPTEKLQQGPESFMVTPW
jgi:divalent metal cation (Fe/Co/Zn/Cd) transporter